MRVVRSTLREQITHEELKVYASCSEPSIICVQALHKHTLSVKGRTKQSKMNNIMDELQEKQQRIAELEEQRKEELENRRWMASCPERKHSYGQYKFFEKSKVLYNGGFVFYVRISCAHNLYHILII